MTVITECTVRVETDMGHRNKCIHADAKIMLILILFCHVIFFFRVEALTVLFGCYW